MGVPFATIVASPPDGHAEVGPSLPGGCADVESAEDLERKLRQIAAECPRPLLVEVYRADGDYLSVGLGRPRSFVTYVPSDGDLPCFSIVGDAPKDERAEGRGSVLRL